MSLFITFEGIEGCGKTTQVGRLAQSFRQNQRPFVLTREPGGTAIGESVRRILLDSANAGLEPAAEFFLYAAARAEHISRVIRPALGEGKVVLCDRYADATLAYQGYGRGLNPAWIEENHVRFLGGVMPHLTFLLDLPPEEGLRRAWKRIETQAVREDRFEREDLAFHRRVREGYLLLARREPGRIFVLDGMKDQEALHRDILARLEKEG